MTSNFILKMAKFLMFVVLIQKTILGYMRVKQWNMLKQFSRKKLIGLRIVTNLQIPLHYLENVIQNQFSS